MIKHVNVFLRILAFILVHYLIMSSYIIISSSVYMFINTVQGTYDEAKFSVFFTNQVVLGVIVGALGALFVYYKMFQHHSSNLFRVVKFKKISLKQVVLSLLIGSSIIFFSGLIVGFAAQLFPDAYESFASSMEELENANVVFLVIAVVIAAPLIEEVLFRGIAMHFLSKHYSVFIVIIVQALLFGIYHMSLIQGLYATGIGIVLGLSFLWTGSIWVPILIHFANNLMSYLMGTEIISQWFESEAISALVFVYVMLFLVLPISLVMLSKESNHRQLDY